MCRLSLGHCNWCMFCRQEPHTFQYLHDATAMSEAMQCHLTRGRNNISMYITYFPSRSCDAGIDKHLGSMLGSLQRSLFFYDYYSGRQLARIVVLPQLRRINLTVHLLSPHSHALRCSLNTAAFQAASAQPGDHPLWDQSTERGRGEGERRERGIWGARLLSLWGVIPEINVEICVNPACQLCHPTFLARPRVFVPSQCEMGKRNIEGYVQIKGTWR